MNTIHLDPKSKKDEPLYIVKINGENHKSGRKNQLFQKPFSTLTASILRITQFKQNTVLVNYNATGLKLNYPRLIKNLCSEISAILFTSSFRVKIPQNFIEELKTNNSFKNQETLLLTGHLGNQEFLGQTLTALGIPLQGFYQKQKSPFWNKAFKDYRKSRGDYAPWEILDFPKAYKKFKTTPFTMGFLWDQYSSSTSAHKSTLGSQEFKTHPLPLKVFKNDKTKCLFAFLLKKEGSYELVYKWGAHPGEFHLFYSQTMSQHPQQWYGSLHKIFKTHITY